MIDCYKEIRLIDQRADVFRTDTLFCCIFISSSLPFLEFYSGGKFVVFLHFFYSIHLWVSFLPPNIYRFHSNAGVMLESCLSVSMGFMLDGVDLCASCHDVGPPGISTENVFRICLWRLHNLHLTDPWECLQKSWIVLDIWRPNYYSTWSSL